MTCGTPTTTTQTSPPTSPATSKQPTPSSDWEKRYLPTRRVTYPRQTNASKMKKLKGFALLVIVFAIGVFVGIAASTHNTTTQNIQNGTLGSAQIESDSTYMDYLGYHVVGEVENTGNISLGFMQVGGIFKNSAGQQVYENWTYTDATYLPSGQKTPFDLIIWDSSMAAQVSSYTLSVFYDWAPLPYSTSLSVINTSGSVNSDGWYQVNGDVMNNGPSTSNFTQVFGTFYNAQGQVIYVDSEYTSSNYIPTSQLSNFTLTVSNSTISSQIKSYSISAESEESQYTSMPQSGVQSTSSPIAVTELSNVTQNAVQTQIGMNTPQQQSQDLVEYCFSSPEPPHGDCDSRLVYWIDQANVSIHIMIYSFTLDDVADALIRAKQRGVDVKIAWDKTEVNELGSQYQKLANAGIDIRIDREPGIDLLHDKVAIIDNHIIITGSFNWSNEANLHDRENLVVINSINWATAYEENFQEIWNASAP